jgi:hypothetical protein
MRAKTHVTKKGNELLFQVTEDTAITFFTKSVRIIEIYGLMYGESEFMTLYESKLFAFRKYGIAAIDGHRYNRDMHLVSKGKGSFPEWHEIACLRARAFRKHHKTHAREQYLFCLTIGTTRLARIAVIDKDIAGMFAAPPKEWDFLKGSLHHPAERDIEIATDEEDIKGSLMIGSIDIGFAFYDMLPTLYLHGY